MSWVHVLPDFSCQTLMSGHKPDTLKQGFFNREAKVTWKKKRDIVSSMLLKLKHLFQDMNAVKQATFWCWSSGMVSLLPEGEQVKKELVSPVIFCVSWKTFMSH